MVKSSYVYFHIGGPYAEDKKKWDKNFSQRSKGQDIF